MRLTESGYQYVGLQNLIQRNEQLFSSENAPSGGVSLPFILVQVNFLPFSFKGIIIFDIVNDLSFRWNHMIINLILFFERNKRDAFLIEQVIINCQSFKFQNHHSTFLYH